MGGEWKNGMVECWSYGILFEAIIISWSCDAFMHRCTFHKGNVLHFDLKTKTFEK
jgi:hypothetical protein